MDFSEKLAKAKAREEERGRPTKTVTVSLDAEVTTRLRELEEKLELEKQKPQDGRLAKKNPLALLIDEIEEVQAEFEDTLVDLKFTRLKGGDWNDLTVTNPPRLNSIPDTQFFGYNIHAVARAAAPLSGVLVADGEEQPLSEAQWADLFELIDGKGHEEIADAIYQLNEGDSKRAVDLGKARRAAALASETKSS